MIISIISILLAFSHFILRKWIVDKERAELPEEGKEVNIWGKLILALVGIVAYVIIIIAYGVEGMNMKWFWMIIVIMASGFEIFIDWKYIRASKQHVVSFIVLVLGVALVYFWL